MEENTSQAQTANKEQSTHHIPTNHELFWVTAGQILTIAGSIVCVKAFTTILPADVYGEFALVLSVSLAYMYIFGVPLSSTAIRFFSVAKQNDNLHQLVLILIKKLRNIGLITLLIWFIYLIAGTYTQLPFNIKYVGVIAFLAVTTTAHTFFNGLQTGARNRATVAGHSTAFEWMRLVFGTGFVLLLGSTVLDLLSGILISSILICISQLYFIKKYILTDENLSSKTDSGTLLPMVTAFYTPLVFSGFFVWGQRFADRWALKAWVSNEEIGNYFALYQLSLAPTLVASALFINLFSPLIFGHAGDADNKESLSVALKNNGKTVMLLVFLSGGSFLLAYLFKDFVVGYFISKDYNVNSNYFPWLVLAGGVFAVSQQLLLSLQSHLKTKSIFFMSAVTITIFASLCYFGAMKYGITGVVGAQVIYSIILFIWSASFHYSLSSHDTTND